MKEGFSCTEIKIPYEDAVRLRQEGVLNLSIDVSIAAHLGDLKGMMPGNKGVYYAFQFWKTLIFLLFLYTVYLSFTANWWWFILGVFGTGMLFNINKKSNAQNMVREGLLDEDFYYRVLSANGWIYLIEESESKKYLLKD